jgi:CTP synthase
MGYKGKCVQVVPHIPMTVVERIKEAAKKSKAEVMVIEIGGTVGEYENILFLEAARMMKLDNPDDVAFVLVSYLPVPSHLGEMKTKPTQHAARTLNNSGIQPDFIIARGKHELDKPRREKLAFFCWLRSKDDVISAPDTESIYDVPDIFEKQNFGRLLARRLKLKIGKTKAHLEWRTFINKMRNVEKKIKIAVVGKYFATGNFTLADSYISVIQAVKHAAWSMGAEAEMTWIDSEEYENNPGKINELKQYGALIVPGGFGTRGIDGIIMAIKYARENKMPYLGLCYGMQLATVEFARNVLGYKDANTVEVNPKTSHPIIHINYEQAKNVSGAKYGGTMRLGAYDCVLKDDTKVCELYGNKKISERHRHRYEFNNLYRDEMEKAGMKIAGINVEKNLVEIIELEGHPFFVGTQFHPEFKSRPTKPHPLFVGLLRSVILSG